MKISLGKNIGNTIADFISSKIATSSVVDFGGIKTVSEVDLSKMSLDIDNIAKAKGDAKAKLSSYLSPLVSKDNIEKFNQQFPDDGYRITDLDTLDTLSGINIVADVTRKLALSTPGRPKINVGNQEIDFAEYTDLKIKQIESTFKYNPKKASEEIENLAKSAINIHNLNSSAYRNYLARIENPSKGNITLQYFGNLYSSLSTAAEYTSRAGMDAVSGTLQQASSFVRGSEALKNSTARRAFNIMKTYNIAKEENGNEKINNFLQRLYYTRETPSFDDGATGTAEKEIYKWIVRTGKAYDPSLLDDNAHRYSFELLNNKDFGLLSKEEMSLNFADLVDIKQMRRIEEVFEPYMVTTETGQRALKMLDDNDIEDLTMRLRQKVENRYVQHSYNQASFLVDTARKYATPLDITGKDPKVKTSLDNIFKITEQHIDTAQKNVESITHTPWGSLFHSLNKFNVSTMLFSERLFTMTMIQPFTQQTFDYGNLFGNQKFFSSGSTLGNIWKTKGIVFGKDKYFTPIEYLANNNKSYMEVLKKAELGQDLDQSEQLLTYGLLEAEMFSGTSLIDQIAPKKVFTKIMDEINPDFSKTMAGKMERGAIKTAETLDFLSDKLGRVFATFEKGTRSHLFLQQYQRAAAVIDDALGDSFEIKKIMSSFAKENPGQSDSFYRRLAVHKYLSDELKVNRFRYIEKREFFDMIDSVVQLSYLPKNDKVYNQKLAETASVFARSVIDQTVFNYGEAAKPGFLGQITKNIPALAPAFTFTSFNFHALQQFSALYRLGKAGDKNSVAQATALVTALWASTYAASEWANNRSKKGERTLEKYFLNYAAGKVPMVSTLQAGPEFVRRPLGGPTAATIMPMLAVGTAIKTIAANEIFNPEKDHKKTIKSLEKSIGSIPMINKIKTWEELIDNLE